jgi:hypothetical protein
MTLMLLLPLAIAQSDTFRLAERPCSDCAITLSRVVTLGDDDGPGAITLSARIAVDARGRYWLGHAGAPAQLAIFSPDGRFQRTVGRSGGGPGEFRRISRMIPFADGMVLFDDFAKRSTVMSLNFDVVDTRPAPQAPESVILRRNLTGVMSAIVPTADLIGFTLHLLNRQGELVGSFAPTGLPYRESMRELFLRGLSPATDTGRYWVSHRMEYAFSLCAHGRTECRLFLRPAGWFPRPAWGPSPDMGTTPPSARLRGVSQDHPRFVWTISWVADARWRSALEKATRTEYRVTDFDRYYDTIVERIDVQAMRVVASVRIDQMVWDFAGPGMAYWRYEDASGNPRVAVARLQLREKP